MRLITKFREHYLITMVPIYLITGSHILHSVIISKESTIVDRWYISASIVIADIFLLLAVWMIVSAFLNKRLPKKIHEWTYYFCSGFGILGAILFVIAWRAIITNLLALNLHSELVWTHSIFELILYLTILFFSIVAGYKQIKES